MKYEIVPSVIATSQVELDTRLKKVFRFAETVHLDVMDGSFVPHTSLQFPFILPAKDYEAHLMLVHPELWILEHGAKMDSIIVHYESEAHLHRLLTVLKKKKISAGIALNPRTNIEAITQYLPLINQVLVMTVEPGNYGGAFLKQELSKVKYLREKAPHLLIEVDGGITPQRLQLCKDAGANRFVVGSYLQNAKSVPSVWKTLTNGL